MKSTALAILWALLFQSTAPEQGGARVSWVRDAQFGLARARLEGRAALLFFTADFCGYCTKLREGALADGDVVAASQRVVPIYVDCTRKGDNADLLTKYGVRGFPTVIYTDADGAPLREMQNRDASAIVKDIETVAGKVAPRPTFWQPSVAFAREAGRKARKPVAVYVVDPKSDLVKVSAKLAKDLGDRKSKFLWVLAPGQPAVHVLDPKEEEPLARIPVKDDDKADVLNKALDEAAKLFKK